MVSQEDLLAFPEFAEKMTMAGKGLDWEAHELTTPDGYILTLWRITGDNSVMRPSTRGPVLLEHGIYSDGLAWMERSDAASPCFPVMLFEMGFDVWIANTRGTPFSQGHTLLDPVIDATLYWNYSFSEIGKVDVPAITDYIIKERFDDACAKITVVCHSTGATEIMQSAVSDPMFNSKVERIVTLAPCYFINMNNFELPLQDRPSAEAFFGLLDTYGIATLWGPVFAEELRQKMCPTNEFYCNILLGLNE